MNHRLLNFWALTMIVILFGSFYISIMVHEDVHVRICESFGGNATVHIRWDQSFTLCYNVNRTEIYHLAQANTENFGYQIEALFIGIWLIVFNLGTLLIVLFKKEEKK